MILSGEKKRGVERENYDKYSLGQRVYYVYEKSGKNINGLFCEQDVRDVYIVGTGIVDRIEIQKDNKIVYFVKEKGAAKALSCEEGELFETIVGAQRYIDDCSAAAVVVKEAEKAAEAINDILRDLISRVDVRRVGLQITDGYKGSNCGLGVINLNDRNSLKNKNFVGVKLWI